MNEVRTTRWPWAIWGLLLCFLGGAIVLSFVNDTFDGFVTIAVPMMLGYGTIGAFVASRVPGNPLGWLMLVVGVSFGVTGLSAEYVVWAVPIDAPFVSVAAWLSNWTYVVVFSPLLLILLLFPTGRVPSPRWRFVPYVIVGAAVALAISAWIRPGVVDADVVVANPTGVEALEPVSDVLSTVGSLALLVSAFASAAALVVRYRTSDETERRQIRALAYLAAISAVLVVAAIGATNLGGTSVENNPVSGALFYALFFIVGIAFPVAIGYAILRRRLFDIDLVVKKTVAYSLVAVALTGLYLAVLAVATLGNVSRLLVGLLLLVVTFRPVLRAARSIADRVVYGRRATPYEVMSEFSERMSETYSTDDVLPRMAAVLQGATGAEAADVWLRVGRELRPSASSPNGGRPRVPVPSIDDTMPAMPGDLAAEVRQQGELLGALAVTMPANDPLDPARERLVRDLAAQAGPVLRNVRLIEELRASRQRMVAAQDEERRKLERNIHDGAQQQLVALSVRTRLADSMVDRDPAKAHEMLAQIQTDTNDALETLRDLARGIYPPLLADKGLTAALQAQARKTTLPIHIEADGVDRYPADVEATVYFCVLEALNNVAKYADAQRVDVTLADVDGAMRFEVRDDGRGFDPVARGCGHRHPGDAGSARRHRWVLHLESHPGAGTTVTGIVPMDPTTSGSD